MTTVSSGHTLNVSATQTSTGVIVLAGGTLNVLSGGTISSTVDSGGTDDILLGGQAFSTTVSSGGDERIEFGGTASHATVYNLGRQDVGGTAIGTIVSGGGAENISSFGPGDVGSAVSTTVLSGGAQYVLEGARAISTTISNGGVAYISAFEGTEFGSAISTTILSGGEQYVYGIAIGTTVSNGGIENLASDLFSDLGTASGTAIDSGGRQYDGGTAVSTTINNGGWQGVTGSATSTTISSGGTQAVGGIASGTASVTTILNGGAQYIDQLGQAYSTTVSSGGIQYISGTAIGTTVSNGGIEYITTGTLGYTGTASGTTVSSGGIAYVLAGGTAIGTTVSSDGGDVVSALGTATSTTLSGGVEEISGGTAISATVDYTLPSNIDALFLYAGAQGTGNSDAAGDALYALDAGNVQTLTGNSPNDTFVVDNSSDVLLPKVGSHDVVYAAASYTLPTGLDTLILEASATQGVGNSDAAGDGLYAANPGQVATLTGNSTNDTFAVYNSSDVVVPKAGSHDVVYAAASYTLPTGVDVLVMEAGTQAVGNSDAAGDALYAANPGQVATLTGNSPNDTFVVYNSSDVVVPKAGSHDLVYSALNYTLPTGVDSLILEASATQGTGNSDAAGDTLYAANPSQAATLTGNSHNDTFVVYNSADTVVGQAGSTDTVYTAASYTLPTNVDTLFLEGNAALGSGNSDAVDTLYGNFGVASTLVAGSGTDMLWVTGVAGTTLTGGAGHDTFAFPNAMGHDEVTNFGTAKDTLQFNASLFANFSAAMASASQVGANTVFTIDGNDTVTLDNVTKTSLTAGNFHFS